MAEKSESINDLKVEIAGSRERVVRELRGLRYELDFPAKFRRSFRKQTGSWLSAATAVGALVALAPMRTKKVYVDARSRRKPEKKLLETGLGLAAVKACGKPGSAGDYGVCEKPVFLFWRTVPRQEIMRVCPMDHSGPPRRMIALPHDVTAFSSFDSIRIRFRTSITISRSGKRPAPRTFTSASPRHRSGE